MDSLNQVVRVRVCLKLSRKDCDQCRVEVSNGCGSKRSEHPKDVTEANVKLEHYCPMYFATKKRMMELTKTYWMHW